MQNVTIIDKEGQSISAVLLGENPDGSFVLTFQSSGGINRVTAEKQKNGTFKVREEKA